VGQATDVAMEIHCGNKIAERIVSMPMATLSTELINAFRQVHLRKVATVPASATYTIHEVARSVYYNKTFKLESFSP